MVWCQSKISREKIQQGKKVVSKSVKHFSWPQEKCELVFLFQILRASTEATMPYWSFLADNRIFAEKLTSADFFGVPLCPFIIVLPKYFFLRKLQMITGYFLAEKFSKMFPLAWVFDTKHFEISHILIWRIIECFFKCPYLRVYLFLTAHRAKTFPTAGS